MNHTLLSLSLALLPLAVADDAPVNTQPENRVASVLFDAAAAEWPPNRPDGADDALWVEDALIPADKLLNLWRAAVDNLAVPLSWFCDAAGDWLVIVSGDAACYHRYHMFVYQWVEAEQGFRRRGEYTLDSRTWALCPVLPAEFLPEGMKVSCCRRAANGEMEYRSHLFPWAQKVAEHRFED